MGCARGVTFRPMAVHPLLSRPVLLTRPRAAAERLAAKLAGIEVLVAPLMEIAGTGAQVDLDEIAGVIFTSANAVPFVTAAPLPAYCVGPRTAAAAREAGFDAAVRGEDADSLVASLVANPPKTPLFHPHGTHVRGDVAERLTASGLETRAAAVYAQVDLAPGTVFANALGRKGLIVPLFSPRSARLFASAARELPADTSIIAFSARVSAELPMDWASITQTLPEPHPDTMFSAILACALGQNSP